MRDFTQLFRSFKRKTIPAFLSIDVEPDGFQPAHRNLSGWTGYSAMIEFAERLRSNLAKRSGIVPKFGWYFRTDPQIAEAYGRPDYVFVASPDRITQLQTNGDYFGVHMHPVRWCEDRRLWVHDFANAEWLKYCTKFSLDAYKQWSGSPAQCFRSGAGFLSNEIIETIDESGVKVDLSLEPVSSWGLTAHDVISGVDSSPILGTYINCRTAPCAPFRPAHHDFRIADDINGRNVIMIPLSTYTVLPNIPSWRKALRHLIREPEQPAQMLYPVLNWPNAHFYWDLVLRQLRSMSRPFLSLAIRTDAVESNGAVKVRRLFDALLQHPLAKQLRFVNPIDIAADLV